MIRRLLSCLAVCAMLGACAAPERASNGFSFALMGDLQYDRREELLFTQLLEAVNREDVAFVVHVGDFKSGSRSPCTDRLYLQRREEFNASSHPFVLLPGDNDWVDCRRPSNGGTDPLERLSRFRQVFYADGFSLGKQPMPLSRQSAVHAGDAVLGRYVENAMWSHRGVVFVTVNVQGSNDNLGFDAASDREHAERTIANLEWVRRAIKRVRDENALALAVFMQANPGFEEEPASVLSSGYRNFFQAFEADVEVLGKPVLFAHGDTHQFRIDRPYRSPLDHRPIANMTRVETYGSPQTNWVRITVNPENPASPFLIRSGDFRAQQTPD